MKATNILVIAILAIASCAASCGKDKDIWEEVQFEFEIPLSITPGTDTIGIGQELTLTANFSDSLFDFISQKKYYLPNFNFKTVAVIQKLINPLLDINQQASAVGKFSFANTIGGFSNFSSTFADVDYLYQNHQYKLNAKLAPNEKGVYIIRFYHSTGTPGQTNLPSELAPSEPGIKRFPIMKRLRHEFNNGQTHFSIYKDNCKPRDPNEATNWVESKATYTFVVK